MVSGAEIYVPLEGIIDFEKEAERLRKRINKVNADLIVMGTHGRTGVEHVIVGSTAERVVRRSKIPVLTVRCQD